MLRNFPLSISASQLDYKPKEAVAKSKLYTNAGCKLRQLEIISTPLGQEVKTKYAAGGMCPRGKSFLPTKDSYLTFKTRCATGMSYNAWHCLLPQNHLKLTRVCTSTQYHDIPLWYDWLCVASHSLVTINQQTKLNGELPGLWSLQVLMCTIPPTC